jgi:hypothetical protein
MRKMWVAIWSAVSSLVLTTPAVAQNARSPQAQQQPSKRKPATPPPRATVKPAARTQTPAIPEKTGPAKATGGPSA